MIVTRETPGAKHLNVYIDGKHHTRCIEVNDETGKAHIQLQDENGKDIIDRVNGDPREGYGVFKWIKADIKLEETEPGVLDAMGWKGGRYKKNEGPH